ncbi:MAG: glutathione S-transferase C-terminal domain-containing protein, partial [SAR324 cluster bacterium]|nr:glutathione S-transferase C-terminal domain-containing protein [SAR324 cluster bacterium]
MGFLLKGKWVAGSMFDKDRKVDTSKGEITQFRNFIGDKFKSEKNRYHLYISLACPWAHRTVIFRKLKGLEHAISMSHVSTIVENDGWNFKDSPDPLYGKQYLRDLYTLSQSDCNCNASIPILWDKETNSIFSNESADIIRMFNKDFANLSTNDYDYYPSNHKSEIDDINQYVFDNIMMSIRKAGFSTNQKDYELGVKKLFSSLDHLEDLLSQRRYLIGSKITEADWRLFTVLLRFDIVYVGHFKCNLKRLVDYHHISSYVRELYQMDGIKETCDIERIKTNFYV